MSVELINAIAGLWKVGLVGFLIALILIFRKQLRNLTDELLDLSIKRGNTEISLKKRQAPAEMLPEVKVGATSLGEQADPGDAYRETEAVVAPSDDLDEKYFNALMDKSLDDAGTIFDEIQRNEQDPVVRTNNEARHYYLLYSFGDEMALGKLQKLARREDADIKTRSWLAIAYEKAGDFERAAATYEESARNCDIAEERARSIAMAAISLFDSGKREDAFAKIMNELAKAPPKEIESHYFEALATLYEKSEQSELRALALEKALEGRPNNKNLRFQAAYEYSQQSFHRLSLLHYKKQIEFHPHDPSSLNNLGVQYDNLGMPMKSIRNYKKAVGLNNTLSMANLAYQFMKAGFASEASQILDKARAREHVHPNVGSAIADIAKMEESEQETEEKCLKTALDQQRFFTSFGEAFFHTIPKRRREIDFSGRWKLPDGTEIEISQEQGRIRSEWASGDNKFSIEGIASNRGLKATLTHTGPYSFNRKYSRIFGYIEESPNEIKVLRTGSSDGDAAMVVYTRVEPVQSSEETNSRPTVSEAQ